MAHAAGRPAHEADLPARPRLTGAVRDRLDVACERDLLLARRRHRERARPDAGRAARRGDLLRADGDDVRRGRVAAPGAGGLDGLRALRLQRAVELHRRLGGAAGLPHPHRRHGVRRDELPRRLLGAAGQGRAGARGRGRDHRLRRVSQHARLLRPRDRADRRARRRRRRAAAADRRPRGLPRRRRRRADGDDPPRHVTALGGRDVRADGLHRRVHEPGVRSGAGRRGPRQPARAQAARRERGGVGDRDLRRDLARRRRRAADHARREPR